jgi:RimJ/RimL family protein N-acetyltransferase
MSETGGGELLRDMTAADVPAVLDVQEPGASRGLADVFPQDTHPFPRDAVARRWEAELVTPGIHCLVIQRHGAVAGFAAIRSDEFLHFGIAVELWGSGLAELAHDAVLDRMRALGIQRAWLRVFTRNARGRRFYEKLGWRPTGERTNSNFPPYPELVHYERSLG